MLMFCCVKNMIKNKKEKDDDNIILLEKQVFVKFSRVR